MLIHLHWTPDDSDQIIAKTRLPTPLHDADLYEIGVLEASVGTEFHNVPHERKIQFANPELLVTQTLPRKHFENLTEFHKSLRDMIKNATFENLIKIEKVGERTRWTLQPNVEIKPQPELKAMLGLSHVSEIKASDTPAQFFGVCDIYRNYRRIFLKSDFIIPTDLIHNTVLPILSSFPVDHTVDTCSVRFNSPIYHKINCKRLEEVTVSMINEVGREMMSSSGSAYCLIHIRPHHTDNFISN